MPHLISEAGRIEVLNNLQRLFRSIGYQSKIVQERSNKSKFSERFILPDIIRADARKDHRYMMLIEDFEKELEEKAVKSKK